MRRRQKENSSVASFQYLKVFLFVLALLILVSLGQRTFTFIRESKFTGDHFVFLVISSEWHLVAVDRQQTQVSIVTLDNVKFDANWRVEKLSYEIGIPIDAVIRFDHKKTFGNFYREFFSWNMANEMFMSKSFQSMEGANTLDILKMYFAARSLRFQGERSLSLTQENGEMNRETEDIFSRFLSDSRLKTENTSVEIVNSSGINGVGRRVAQLLTNLGFHIISVTSSEVRFPSQIAFRGDKSYAAQRLERIFQIPSFHSSSQTTIADVTVVIGEDYVKKVE